jgi:hypothetical protein
MKEIVKSVPSRNYRSRYEPSIALIESIAKDGTDVRNGDELTADQVLTAFLNGETVTVLSPFGQEVHWTLEDTTFEHWKEERAEKAKHRYTVEQQADKTWAIFHGGGFVQGGYRTREAGVYDANCMITADREAGVPVEMGVG